MRKRRRYGPASAVPLLAVALAAGCGEGAPPDAAPAAGGPLGPPPEAVTRTPIFFQEAAGQLGIDFAYRNGVEAGYRAMPEVLGGGIGLLDYDADGRADVLLAGGGGFDGEKLTGRRAAVFRREGPRFADRAAAANLGGRDLYSHAVCVADYDSDGFRDVLITGWAGVRLSRNQGDGTFADVTAAAALTDPRWTATAVWGDFNGDGHPDLVLVRYVGWSFAHNPQCTGRDGRRDVCSPVSFEPLPDSLFLSEADGTFRDATAGWGLRADGKGLGAVAADLDLDGDLDLYIANDTTANFLYRNDGGRFAELGLVSGAGYDAVGAPDGSMGTDVGDFDGDGRLDLWVVNFEQEAFALYRNTGDLTYLHASEMTGVAAEGGLYVGWGTLFFDFDLDADLDLFVSNGHSDYFPEQTDRRQRPLLFENRHGARFANVAPADAGYFSAAHDGRGAACGDLDNDGRPDLVVSHVNTPAAVLLNRTPAANGVTVRLVGTRSPREPIGATVTVEAGDRRRVIPVRGGGSYLSTGDERLVIGLGDFDRADTLTVRWPAGAVQSVRGPAAGEAVLLVEGRDRLLNETQRTPLERTRDDTKSGRGMIRTGSESAPAPGSEDPSSAARASSARATRVRW